MKRAPSLSVVWDSLSCEPYNPGPGKVFFQKNGKWTCRLVPRPADADPAVAPSALWIEVIDGRAILKDGSIHPFSREAFAENFRESV